MYRLLLKIHNKTGLKYLCKTEKDDYINYLGSGTDWKPHLKKYGRDVSTELLFETENFEEFRKVALAESIERDIVNSKEYANLKMEVGDGGDYWSGKEHPNFGKHYNQRENHPNFGKHPPEETKKKLRDSHIGKVGYWKDKKNLEQ